jgi:hypothetical protein
MHVTCLLGAGASVDIGGPLSSDLTTLVRQKQQQTINSQQPVPFLDRVGQILDTYFHPQNSHFEDIFFTLESLNSILKGRNPGTVKDYKPHLGAFIDLIDPFFQDWELLYNAKKDLISVVADRIYQYDQYFTPAGQHAWYSRFWQNAICRCQWHIATLNYDHCIESSIGLHNYEDGFEDIGEPFKRFNHNKFLQSSMTKVMHLHGSIRYGHPNLGNRFIYEDDHEDLYLFDTYQNASQTWFNRSGSTSQSHDETLIGPIITGLRKTDKILPLPYQSYYYQFQKSLIDSPRLLIIGYSFGDYYINSLLERISRFHGQNRKVVLITYLTQQQRHDWTPDVNAMDWVTNKMFTFLAKSFMENNPFNNRFTFQDPMVSHDQRIRVYFGGVQDAFTNHGADILHSLTT